MQVPGNQSFILLFNLSFITAEGALGHDVKSPKL